MEKRTIIALGLTLAIIIFFQMYMSPKEPQKQPVQPAQKTEQAAQKGEEKGAAPSSVAGGVAQPSAAMPKAALKATRTITADTDLLRITFTDLGGGISSVKLKKYKEKVKGPDDKEMLEDLKPYVYVPKVFAAVSRRGVTDGPFQTRQGCRPGKRQAPKRSYSRAL